jgi:hypothetical protein
MVRADELVRGDELADGTFVSEVYHEDGLWIAFSDGSEGYVTPSRLFTLAV